MSKAPTLMALRGWLGESLSEGLVEVLRSVEARLFQSLRHSLELDTLESPVEREESSLSLRG